MTNNNNNGKNTTSEIINPLYANVKSTVDNSKNKDNIYIQEKLEKDIQIMRDNAAKDDDLKRKELKRILTGNIRGVEMYVHGKPYPDYSWAWDNERKQNFLSKINFRVIGRDNPYAKVDENLRQLKKYTNNDSLPRFIISPNRHPDTNDIIESTTEKNNNRKNPTEYNTYVKKSMLFYPSGSSASNVGGKKRSSRRINQKHKSKPKSKTKSKSKSKSKSKTKTKTKTKTKNKTKRKRYKI